MTDDATPPERPVESDGHASYCYAGISTAKCICRRERPEQERPDMRCSACREEFAEAALPEGTSACPSCGTTAVPQFISHDVTLTLNWHDLRCLAQWAENYVHANKGDPDWEHHWEVLKDQIRRHRPPGAASLTLLEEIEDVRRAGFDITLHEGPNP